MKNKRVIIFLIVLGVGLTAGFLFSEKNPLPSAPLAQAGVEHNLSGYAWSENIGWISFNCTDNNSCLSSNYGVNIDSVSGDFSGYAWSENIGWVSFEPDFTACPAGDCFAKLDIDEASPAYNEVSGWARILSVADNQTAGWVSFNSKNFGSTYDYGVIRSGCNLTGWAWNDDIIGWIQFDPVIGEEVKGVVISDPDLCGEEAVNTPPVAIINTALTIFFEGDQITLNGSDSFDPEGGEISYSWTAPAGITLSDPTGMTTEFIAPEVSENTTYIFGLTVTDDFGATDSTSKELIIQNIEPAQPDFTLSVNDLSFSIELIGEGSTESVSTGINLDPFLNDFDLLGVSEHVELIVTDCPADVDCSFPNGSSSIIINRDGYSDGTSINITVHYGAGFGWVTIQGEGYDSGGGQVGSRQQVSIELNISSLEMETIEL